MYTTTEQQILRCDVALTEWVSKILHCFLGNKTLTLCRIFYAQTSAIQGCKNTQLNNSESQGVSFRFETKAFSNNSREIDEQNIHSMLKVTNHYPCSKFERQFVFQANSESNRNAVEHPSIENVNFWIICRTPSLYIKSRCRAEFLLTLFQR